jgi:hypothetical protein
MWKFCHGLHLSNLVCYGYAAIFELLCIFRQIHFWTIVFTSFWKCFYFVLMNSFFMLKLRCVLSYNCQNVCLQVIVDLLGYRRTDALMVRTSCSDRSLLFGYVQNIHDSDKTYIVFTSPKLTQTRKRVLVLHVSNLRYFTFKILHSIL